MEEENKVELYGAWFSPPARRVELALKAKGISYEWIEEDLYNKSELLLTYNPVYKKVPVLVHDGKPILESPIILEYIDETWKNPPHFMPDDPYKRAKVRFWASFFDQQLKFFESFHEVLKVPGEAQEKAIQEVQNKLRVMEDNIEDIFPQGSFHEECSNLGLLDILMCTSWTANKAIEEAVNVKLVDPEKFPKVFSWIAAIAELQPVKETDMPRDKLVAFFRSQDLSTAVKAVAESRVIPEYMDKTWKHASFLTPEDPYKRAPTRFWANFLRLRIVEQAIGVKYIDPEESPMLYSWVTALAQLPAVKELAPPPANAT
ncbi:Glutathione S-transferase, N-terminal [Dillenia turbinata]|uniref:glutathione transferase n=1 Tax=Dillenia turbinata TaxID=194707 RepID=A0AAN8VC72_9MAGN